MFRSVPISILLALTLVGCGSRPAAQELAQVVEALRLQPGMQVADVGAGEGEWTEELARVVGATGHVYSTEVDEDDLERIRERVDDAGLTNVTALLGDATDNGLPDACCDAILLRLVYHHFTEPEAMRDKLVEALRPGGRLVVVEVTTQTSWGEIDGVPDRGGHGIDPESLIEEMTGAGWTVLEREDSWGTEKHHYGVIFSRPR